MEGTRRLGGEEKVSLRYDLLKTSPRTSWRTARVVWKIKKVSKGFRLRRRRPTIREDDSETEQAALELRSFLARHSYVPLHQVHLRSVPRPRSQQNAL